MVMGGGGLAFPIKCLSISLRRKLTWVSSFSFDHHFQLRGDLSNISMPTIGLYSDTLGLSAAVGKGERTSTTLGLPVTIFTQAAGPCFAFSGERRDQAEAK